MAGSQSYPKRGDPGYAAWRSAKNETRRVRMLALSVERRQELRAHRREYEAVYYRTHRRYYSPEYQAAYSRLHAEKKKAQHAARYFLLREELKARARQRYRQRREAALAQKKEYQAANKHHIAAYRKVHHAKPDVRESRKAYMRGYTKKRRRTNPQARILGSLRARVRNALHSYRNGKTYPTMRLIGCTLVQLIAHIEAQLSPDMSWDNYGSPTTKRRVWNIDHIVPCASFDLRDPEQQIACFHFTNLRPLWSTENRAKWHRLEAV